MRGSLFKINIKSRILLLVLLTVISMGGVFSLASYYISQALFEARYEQTRRLVEAAATMVDASVALGRVKGKSTEDIKQEVLNHLREMRYDEKEYFWVNDLDGVFLMHPYPSLNRKAGIDLKDAHGKKIMKDFLQIVKEKGGGEIFLLLATRRKGAAEGLLYQGLSGMGLGGW